MRRLGLTVQVPRPRHAPAASEAEPSDWKKLQQCVTDLSNAARAPRREVWCQDEARLGLKRIVRRVWALRGPRPTTSSHTRDEWLYVYGFVRPTTGQTYWLILPTANPDAMNVALAEFARDVGAGVDKRILLIVDNAGWHTSKALGVPDGVEWVYLPPATPELQPAERLWSLVREAVAKQAFATLDHWQEVLVQRCLARAAQPAIMQGATKSHWFRSF